MADLDAEIREALDEEDRALMEQFGEQGLIGQTMSMFQGKQGWIAMITVFVSLILFGIAVYAVIQFFGSATTEARLLWGAVTWGLLTMVSFIKVWFWIRMESNRVIREVKRIELQIARLNAKS